MKRNITTYTGLILLDKIWEFTEMTPDPAKWNLKSLKDNPPRSIRLRQIASLLNAFCNMGTNNNLLTKIFSSGDHRFNIEAFLEGSFIRNYTAADYAEATTFIKEFVATKSGDKSKKREIALSELIFLFPKLIAFKKQVRSLLTFNSGWIEASSDVALFSIYITNEVAENLVAKYDQLDFIIEQLINPKGLTFTVAELIERYNFPKEDLNSVDMDFI